MRTIELCPDRRASSPGTCASAGSKTSARRPGARPSTRSIRSGNATEANAAASSFGLADAISQSAHRLDRRRSELPPQPSDEHFDRVRIAVGILGVDVLRQLAL